MHAAEWAHGDLGNLAEGVCVLGLSHSGRTSELAAISREAKARGLTVVSILGGGDDAALSPVGVASTDIVGYTLPPDAIEPYGGAPTCSIIAQEQCANALVSALGALAGFDQPSFARNHPGGALGQALEGSSPA